MHAIEVKSLSGRKHDRGAALKATFSVPTGARVGLVGPEGAGKTALVRLLLNLDPIGDGTVWVLGRSGRRLGGAIFARIGYVPQQNLVPLSLTVRQHLARWRAFYPGWDESLALRLGVRLGVPMDTRAMHLERPVRLKASLLSSIAYRPELLVLDGVFDRIDEESREEIRVALDEVLDAGRGTLLVCAREASAVEDVCDHLAWLQEGRVPVCDRVDALREQYRRITVTFPHPPGRVVETPPHWILLDARGRRLHAVDTRFGDGGQLRAWQAPWPGAHVEVRPMAMDEIGDALLRRELRASEGRAA